MQILSSSYSSMRKGIHSSTSRRSSLGACETHRDAKIVCTVRSCIHIHADRVPTHITRGQLCLTIYRKLDSLTQAFPERAAGMQGSGIQAWVDVPFCLTLMLSTVGISVKLKWAALGRPPSLLPCCPPVISRPSPYALSPFHPLLCKCPCGLSSVPT